MRGDLAAAVEQGAGAAADMHIGRRHPRVFRIASAQTAARSLLSLQFLVDSCAATEKALRAILAHIPNAAIIAYCGRRGGKSGL